MSRESCGRFGWLIVSMQLAALAAHGSGGADEATQYTALCGQVVRLALADADELAHLIPILEINVTNSRNKMHSPSPCFLDSRLRGNDKKEALFSVIGINNRPLILGERLRAPFHPMNPSSSVCLKGHPSSFLAADLNILPTDAFGLDLDDRLTQVTKFAPRRLDNDCWTWRGSELVICGIPRWLWVY